MSHLTNNDNVVDKKKMPLSIFLHGDNGNKSEPRKGLKTGKHIMWLTRLDNSLFMAL